MSTGLGYYYTNPDSSSPAWPWCGPRGFRIWAGAAFLLLWPPKRTSLSPGQGQFEIWRQKSWRVREAISPLGVGRCTDSARSVTGRRFQAFDRSLSPSVLGLWKCLIRRECSRQVCIPDYSRVMKMIKLMNSKKYCNLNDTKKHEVIQHTQFKES